MVRLATALLGTLAVWNASIAGGAPTKNAFASLLYGSDPEIFVSLRVAMHSLAKLSSKADRLALIPEGNVALGFRDILEQDGIRVMVVPPIAVPLAMLNNESMDRWDLVMTKFRAFNLTMYDKVCLLDVDIHFSATADPDMVFEDCGNAEICITQDDQPWLFAGDCGKHPSSCFMQNTGLVVLKPSLARLAHLLLALAKERHHFHFPDQQFLSRYVNTHKASLPFKPLSRRWNSCGASSGPERVHDLELRPSVVHFCGAAEHKPYFYRFCRAGQNCSALQAWHQELKVLDNCTSEPHKHACAAQANCHWCGHYCMGTRIACSDRMLALDCPSSGEVCTDGDPVKVLDNLSSITSQAELREATSPRSVHTQTSHLAAAGVAAALACGVAATAIAAAGARASSAYAVVARQPADQGSAAPCGTCRALLATRGDVV